MPAAGDAYEQAQSVALIEQSLGQLNERYRAALVLKDLHGLGGDELAEVLEVSRPAADVLVHRARASFKKAFAGLAGEGFAAPANLALALPVLTVPAALQALPPLPASLAPPHLAAAPGSTSGGPGPGSIVGPAGTGLLAKLATAAGTKAAIVAGAAAIVAGGGLALQESRHHGAAAGGAAVAAAATIATCGPGDTRLASYNGPHDMWAAHRHAVAGHAAEHARHDAHHFGAGAHTGGHSSTAEHATVGDAHAPATWSMESTTPMATHHADSGDLSMSHDGGH